MLSRSNLIRLAQVTAVTALYIIAAKIGLSLAVINISVSPLWPPTGVAIAALIIFGYPAAIGVFLGAFIANDLFTPSAKRLA